MALGLSLSDKETCEQDSEQDTFVKAQLVFSSQSLVPVCLSHHANSLSLIDCVQTGSLILILFSLIGSLTNQIRSFDNNQVPFQNWAACINTDKVSCPQHLSHHLCRYFGIYSTNLSKALIIWMKLCSLVLFRVLLMLVALIFSPSSVPLASALLLLNLALAGKRTL